MARQATQRRAALQRLVTRARPAQHGRLLVARKRCQLAPRQHHQGNIDTLGLEHAHALFQAGAVTFQCLGWIAQAFGVFPGLAPVGGAHLFLGGRVQQLIFQRRDLGQLRAIHHGRDRRTELFVGQPGDGDQERHQQHQVLRHLCPGDCAHASQKGTQQHAAQTQQDADLELHPRQPRRDQSYAVDLSDHVNEGTDHRAQRGDEARPAASEALGKEVRHRVEVHGAKPRRDEQRHQAEPSGPSEHISQAARLTGGAGKALQIERARQAEKRRRAHPVCRRGHAVVERRDAAAGDIELVRIGGAAVDADHGVGHHGQEQEHRADPGA